MTPSCQLRSEDEFAAWVAAVPAHIGRLDGTGGLTARDLDFTPDSLRAVDRFVLARYPSSAELFAATEVPVFHGLAAYIGEVYIRWLGGSWAIVLEDRPNGAQHMYKGYPMVRGQGGALQHCPHASVMSRVKRRDDLDLKTCFDRIAANLARRAATSTSRSGDQP
jgi:hypothetical protein